MSDKKKIEKLEEIITLYSEHSSGLSSEIWHKIDNLKHFVCLRLPLLRVVQRR
jgi:hypothetical protein